MKILAGSFQCESNTFCPDKVKVEDFEVFDGDTVLDKMASTSVFAEAGAKVVPILYASALPGGVVMREAFEYFRDRFFDMVRMHKDADGIYLYLHGSMYVEGIGSGELAMVKAIRDVIGPECPVSLAMDFHANIPVELAGLVNAVNGFRTTPHTDHDNTERRAAISLLKCIAADYRGKTEIVRLPFLCGDAATTDRQPFPDVTKLLKFIDDSNEGISAAFFNGQPWHDSPYTGANALVSASDGSSFEKALQIAKSFWDNHKLLTLENTMSPDSTVEYSLKHKEGVLFVTDSGDNTTAGAPGKGTFLLRKYLERNAENVLICGIFDEALANELLENPIGAQCEIVLCKGKNEAQEQEVTLDVTVKEKGVVIGWAGEEIGGNVLVGDGHIDIALSNVRAAYTTPAHFTKARINPKKYKVVVLKMGYLFPELQMICNDTIFALTPGQSTNDFSTLDYRYLDHRVYPICEDIQWEEIEEAARRRS